MKNKNKFEDILDSYKASLSTRIQPIIDKCFSDYVPSFVKLCQTIKPKSKSDDWFMPTGTKWVNTNETNCLLLLEQPPQVRTITSRDHWHEGYSGSNIWQLSFPYVLFLMAFERTGIFWTLRESYLRYSNKPIENMDSVAYEANLPNLYVSECGRICLGNKSNTEKSRFREKSLSKQAEVVISEFWQNHFTDELNSGYTMGGLDFETWEKRTKSDPAFILRMNWKSPITVGAWIEKVRWMNSELALIKEKAKPDLDRLARQAWINVKEETGGIAVDALDKETIAALMKVKTRKKAKK
jgi:hypothetical protein